jgi:hypothetical protein
MADRVLDRLLSVVCEVEKARFQTADASAIVCRSLDLI